MKKADLANDDARPEYHQADLGKAIRGKYAPAVLAESNVVVLDEEVFAIFPNAKAVNDALRSLIAIANATTAKGKPGRTAVPKKSIRKNAPDGTVGS